MPQLPNITYCSVLPVPLKTKLRLFNLLILFIIYYYLTYYYYYGCAKEISKEMKVRKNKK
jgi:hypothetical protein